MLKKGLWVMLDDKLIIILLDGSAAKWSRVVSNSYLQASLAWDELTISFSLYTHTHTHTLCNLTCQQCFCCQDDSRVQDDGASLGPLPCFPKSLLPWRGRTRVPSVSPVLRPGSEKAELGHMGAWEHPQHNSPLLKRQE